MKTYASLLTVLAGACEIVAVPTFSPLREFDRGLVFYLPFDDGPEPAIPVGGRPAELAPTWNLTKGLVGNALLGGRDFVSRYAIPKEMKRDAGTFCLWYRPRCGWTLAGNTGHRQTVSPTCHWRNRAKAAVVLALLRSPAHRADPH